MKSKKVYVKGSEDVERVFDHLASEEKKARRIEWLKANYSKSNKGSKPNKEEDKS